MRRMYRHARVMQPVARAQDAVRELFDAFWPSPRLLPADWTAACGDSRDSRTARVVSDYIAGMTDRFVADEYARVLGRDMSHLESMPGGAYAVIHCSVTILPGAGHMSADRGVYQPPPEDIQVYDPAEDEEQERSRLPILDCHRACSCWRLSAAWCGLPITRA